MCVYAPTAQLLCANVYLFFSFENAHTRARVYKKYKTIFVKKKKKS